MYDYAIFNGNIDRYAILLNFNVYDYSYHLLNAYMLITMLIYFSYLVLKTS